MNLWKHGLNRGTRRPGPNDIRSSTRYNFFRDRPHLGHKPPLFGVLVPKYSTTQLSSQERGRKLVAQIYGERGKDDDSDRDLLLSVLSSTSTKREARSYLSRFTPVQSARSNFPKQLIPSKDPRPHNQRHDSGKVNRSGVNLGDLYVHTARAIDTSPVFSQNAVPEPLMKDAGEPLHIALIKLRAPHLLSEATLEGVAHTLSQLRKLGLSSIIVVDCKEQYNVSGRKHNTRDWCRVVAHQADRVAAAIDSHKGPGARRLDNIIEVCAVNEEVTPTVSARGKLRVTFRELLLAPLRRGVIPVIPTIGYTSDTQIAVSILSDDVVLALAREFAGTSGSASNDDNLKAVDHIRAFQSRISLDKIIILEPMGGIPSRDRPDGAHVFINMEQEYNDIKNELLGRISMATSLGNFNEAVRGSMSDMATLTSTDGIAESAQTRDASINSFTSNGQQTADGGHLSRELRLQLQNLQLTQQALALLPPTASAVITTPEEAANSGRPSAAPFLASNVGTRRQKNPLIHNLLTDKPAYSSSLPVERLTRSEKFNHMPPHIQASPTTFAKRGMPVTIHPDPRRDPWTPPLLGDPRLTLDHASIDLPRLVHLIEDSFNRKLDVPNYLERINKRVAGVIIAGEYEGGAILTWECPPGVSDDGSEASRLRMVPYLDKFAVLKRSQGAGGVADIVFKAMVRTCFPNGVTWRSRKDNPVNKWYFERSRGSWKIPDSNWTMFWTTEGLLHDKQTFLDYEGVSRGIVPSWADKKTMPD